MNKVFVIFGALFVLGAGYLLNYNFWDAHAVCLENGYLEGGYDESTSLFFCLDRICPAFFDRDSQCHDEIITYSSLSEVKPEGIHKRMPNKIFAPQSKDSFTGGWIP